MRANRRHGRTLVAAAHRCGAVGHDGWMQWQPDQSSLEARLAAAERTIADLQRRVAALEGADTQPARPAAAGGASDAADPWSVPPWPQIVDLLRRGKKIEAIKVHREQTGSGLKEAKDVVEEVERRLR